MSGGELTLSGGERSRGAELVAEVKEPLQRLSVRSIVGAIEEEPV